MKPHKKPCTCDVCEQARYNWPCSGCGNHPSFWKTIIESEEWRLWQIEQSRRFDLFIRNNKTKLGVYDMPECEECGWISPEHWQSFIQFIKKLK